MSTTLDLSPNTLAEGQVHAIPLALIVGDPDNERAGYSDVAALRTSLAAQGQQEPIQVYALGSGRYLNKTGHRRCAAARALGWETIQAIIVPAPPDFTERALGRIVSNLQRADLDPIKLAVSLQAILDSGIDQATLAARMGHTQPWISNLLRLRALPGQVQALISAGKLTPAHGVELLRINQDEYSYQGPTGKTAADVQARIAQEVADGGGSVSSLHSEIDSWHSNQKYYRTQAAQQARWAARWAAEKAAETAAKAAAKEAKARGDDPDAAAEAARQTAQADLDRAFAEAQAKEQAAREKEQVRFDQRAAIANQVIDRILKYNPDPPPHSMEVYRLGVMVAVNGSGADYHTREEWQARIEAAYSFPALLDILCDVARATLKLDHDRRTIQNMSAWEVVHWADKRWFLNAEIADALLDAKLINKLSYNTLIRDSAQRPPAPSPTGDGATS